jgi:molecular chaperone Hsp33
MGDYLIRVLAKEAGVRALICLTTELVNEAADRHQTSPTATVALSRALTGAALMGALLKVKQRVALKFEGNGPLRKIIVEADSYGRVRGYVDVPDADLPLIDGAHDLVHAIGQAGLLTVVRDLRLKELAEGVVPLAVSDIVGDLNDFFVQSEQIPTTVQIGEVVSADGRITLAGGLLIQDIPTQGSRATFAQLQDRLQEMPPLIDLLRDGQTAHQIVAQLFTGLEYELLEERELAFQCDCSWERTREALLSLGAAEIEHLRETDGEIMVTCHYCGESYLFDEFDLEVMLAELSDSE